MCRLARHIALASLLTITDGLIKSTKHLERLDAWLTNASAPPPIHWRVRSPDDLDNRTDHMHSGYKDVWLSQLRDGRRVVVKTLHHNGAFEFGDRTSDIAYFELLFLEGLRGEPGIPKLFGAYETPTHLVWVTSNGGGPVATGRAVLNLSGKKSEIKYSEVYDARARDAPLDLARAWLRCFRSFGERGGFVLTDFKPEQFTLDANGDIYLVDGPAPNSGPIAALARRHFQGEEWHSKQAYQLERARRRRRRSPTPPGRSATVRRTLASPCRGGGGCTRCAQGSCAARRRPRPRRRRRSGRAARRPAGGQARRVAPCRCPRRRSARP